MTKEIKMARLEACVSCRKQFPIELLNEVDGETAKVVALFPGKNCPICWDNAVMPYSETRVSGPIFQQMLADAIAFRNEFGEMLGDW